MSDTATTAREFLTAFKALPNAEREAVLVELAKDSELFEDLADIAVIESRRREPSRPLQEFLDEYG